RGCSGPGMREPGRDGPRVAWRPRAVPLEPRAAAASGRAARALAARLLEREDATLARLSGVAGEDVLLVAGAAAELPWVDGIVYLGRDVAAPSLLLPTCLEPVLPLPLVERALVAKLEAPALPLAALVSPDRLVAFGVARPLDRARLRAWIEARR